MYKLDKKFTKAGTLKEAESKYAHWKKTSYAERLMADLYLICSAYRIDPDHLPPMDKTVFSVRKLKQT